LQWTNLLTREQIALNNLQWIPPQNKKLQWSHLFTQEQVAVDKYVQLNSVIPTFLRCNL
jgi:hypothetical protein